MLVSQPECPSSDPSQYRGCGPSGRADPGGAVLLEGVSFTVAVGEQSHCLPLSRSPPLPPCHTRCLCLSLSVHVIYVSAQCRLGRRPGAARDAKGSEGSAARTAPCHPVGRQARFWSVCVPTQGGADGVVRTAVTNRVGGGAAYPAGPAEIDLEYRKQTRMD